MKKEIVIPEVGESVTEATIARFIKNEGDFVQKNEEIVEIETEKLNQVLNAPDSGKISWSVAVDDTVQVGQKIGVIDTDAKPSKDEKEKPKEEKSAPEEKKPPKKEVAEGKIRESEQEYLEKKEEIKAPIEEKPVEKKDKQKEPSRPERRERMSKIRKVIAKRLLEVKQDTAMLTTFNEVDMSQIVSLREREKENFLKKYHVKLGFTSFFVKASVSALQAFPDINAYIEGDEIVYHDYCDIGVAVGTDKGLMVPVIKDCHLLTVTEVEIKLKEFAEKARNGTISVDEIKGGTFTITNGGMYGSLLSTPILNPPQSAILGIHAIQKRAVVINDQIEIRPMMYLALSYDHRIVDGKEAISFLVHIKKNLEDPARFLLDI